MPKRRTLWIVWPVIIASVVAVVWLLTIYASRGIPYVGLPSGFLINTSGCRIPYMDPFDPSILQFIFDEEDTRCAETYGTALVESNTTSLFINKSAMPFYKVRHIDDLRCCYTPFWRVELEKNTNGYYPRDVDALTRSADICTPFTDQVDVNYEFVKVQCFLNSYSKEIPIYKDYHAFTPNKPISKTLYDQPSKNGVSVMIVGVDTVSRLNLYRQMPLTLNFLKHNLSAVEFLGYNKVGDNTLPNMIPVLTGLFLNELKDLCLPRDDSVFDYCPFVWNKFREAGHLTGFLEDCPWDDGIFSFAYQGFRKQPTDYYSKPFFKQADDISFNNWCKFEMCLGPRKKLQVLLNYALKFAFAMKDFLSFIFVWSGSLTHDFFNLPKQGDVHYKEFLEKLYREQVFNRTVLVFTSDHGMRWGKVRETYQGYFEERLPCLFIAYPDWFSRKFNTAVSNLKTNSLKLTTPFDLHETLLDLANLTRLEMEVLKARSENLDKTWSLPRGVSLFLPIPGKRSCRDADISDHWCTCHESVSVSTDDRRVKSAADYLVNHINSLIKDYPRCATLKLNNITNARQEKAKSHKTFETSDGGLTDFSVIVETVPGKALFESTVRYNDITNNFTTVGIVSRINLYGNQSSCITHFTLRLYCYCTPIPL